MSRMNGEPMKSRTEEIQCKQKAYWPAYATFLLALLLDSPSTGISTPAAISSFSISLGTIKGCSHPRGAVTVAHVAGTMDHGMERRAVWPGGLWECSFLRGILAFLWQRWFVARILCSVGSATSWFPRRAILILSGKLFQVMGSLFLWTLAGW